MEERTSWTRFHHRSHRFPAVPRTDRRPLFPQSETDSAQHQRRCRWTAVAPAPEIVDAMTGEPVTGALVDIWHCNARGAIQAGAGSIRTRSQCRPLARSRAPTMTPTCAAAQFCDKRATCVLPRSIRGSMPVVPCTFMWRCASVPVQQLSGRTHVAWVGQLYFPEVASRSVLNVQPTVQRTSRASLNNAQDHFLSTMGGEGSTLSCPQLGRDSNEDGFFGH
jgi:hypothetical protein